MKILILAVFPLLLSAQEKNEWSTTMKAAMSDIKEHNFEGAIKNLDRSLKIVPNNWSALYFKGYSQIILARTEEGCSTLIDAIYYGGNNETKKVYAEKCIEYDPQLNPEQFKSGKFTLQVLGSPSVYNFERKNGMQYESEAGQVYSGTIKWFENGDYTIIPTEETKKMMTENPRFLTRILKISGNEYLYEKIEEEKQVQFGIIKKID
ncbi:hypothetical protein [uncultured Chryseobacterium sp.]|uniref:hypothetical protein n=1 Tax=uncultured Chryseobacterium sp. TaxID=259322 RepID=UPI00374A4D2A